MQELGYINEDQINQAVAYQKENKGVRLGAALIALGFITEKQMLEALGKRLNYEVVNISDLSVDVKAVEMIPRVLAEKYNMMGYKVEDTMYYLLVDDPLNFYGIEDIRQIVGREVHISLCEGTAGKFDSVLLFRSVCTTGGTEGVREHNADE